ncbi:MAG TPA: hypothetical protein VM095_15150 [Pyrinomonadaceae bacterium]|nr:hypothetical protein [Pyrinomonadaceae bacterium]
MKNHKSLLAAFACGLLFLFTSAREAAAQGLPPGSYIKTCGIATIIDDVNLSGYCTGKDGGAHQTKLNYFPFCDGDIWNDDGALKCNQSDQSPRFKAAVKTFTNLSFVMIGRAPEGKGIAYGSEIRKWVLLMYSKYGMRRQYENGMSDEDARNLLQRYLAEMENGQLRGEIADRAYRQALGRAATVEESVIWAMRMQAQKSHFQHIFNTLSGDPTLRLEMLNRVYQVSMGRRSREGDRNYWLTRKESYGQILDANRSWLYSAQGASDLDETARRAAFWWTLIEALNNPLAKPVPKDDASALALMKEKADKALPGYKAKKMIFIEMIGGDQSISYEEYLKQKGIDTSNQTDDMVVVRP